MNEFKPLNGSIPQDIEENETIWLYNENNKWLCLGCAVYEDGWMWAVSNGVIYAENGQIVSECECDDDYEFTHYCKLPKLP